MQVIEWEVKTMSQGEEFQKASNASSGSGSGGGGHLGRSYKKQKPKKVPQRGLGVAQLEKIRLEEQTKDGGGCGPIILPRPPTPPPMPPPIKPEVRTLNEMPVPNYQSFTSSNPYQSIGLSPNSLRKLQNGEIVNPNSTVQLGWQSNAHNTRNQDDCRIDHGLAFGTNIDLSYDLSDPVWPIPNLIQRAQPYQHNLCSTMANVSAASSCSSSSLTVLNFQLEPPSNQSFHGKRLPVWPEDEKMVGMKRAYAFLLDKQLGQSSHCQIPPIDYPVSNSSDESAFNFNPGIKVFREGVSCSSSKSMLNPKKRIKDNRNFSGDFLILAPPTPTKIGLKPSGPSSLIPFHEYQKLNLKSQNYEVEDQILQQGSNLRNHHHLQQQPFYSFLPQSNLQINHHGINGFSNSCNGSDVGDSVIDLNLKL